MCKMCRKYGKRLVLTPIDERETKAWHMIQGIVGWKHTHYWFKVWHRWFYND